MNYSAELIESAARAVFPLVMRIENWPTTYDDVSEGWREVCRCAAKNILFACSEAIRKDVLDSVLTKAVGDASQISLAKHEIESNSDGDLETAYLIGRDLACQVFEEAIEQLRGKK